MKEYLVANDKQGAIIYYGCAAAEGAGAKQFMARAGLFDGADFIYMARTKELVKLQNGGKYECPLPDSVKLTAGKY